MKNSPSQKEITLLRTHSHEIVKEWEHAKKFFLNSHLSSQHISILVEVHQQEALNIGDLADTFCLDPSSMSRSVDQLTKKGYLKAKKNPDDKREKLLSLTAKGNKAVDEINQSYNKRVKSALLELNTESRNLISRATEKYAWALKKGRLLDDLQIRPIQSEDNSAIAKIIRQSLRRFGAVGEGFSIEDSEIDNMSEAYKSKGHIYLVITDGVKILGGSGIGPLTEGPQNTCELRKMHFSHDIQGFGFGQKLLALCLQKAKKQGYRKCYLETLEHMKAAKTLYEKNGFRKLKKPLGNTGHFRCNSWYLKSL